LDLLSLALASAAALATGAAGAVVAAWIGRDQGGRDVALLRHLAPHAGFGPTADGRWKHEGLARSVYLVLGDNGDWSLVSRCAATLPMTLRSGTGATAQTGDAAFDTRYTVSAVSDFTDLWRCLGAGARGALTRLALVGDVLVTGNQVFVTMDRAPSVAELTRLASEVANAADGLGLRAWEEVADEEPSPVLAALLRELVARDPGAAERVARRVRARRHGPADVPLDTEVARALRDGPALLELLAAQPDEHAVARLADRLTDDDLAEALAIATTQRAVACMAGCSSVALERADRPVVQRAALDAMRDWLAPGALKMDFVAAVAVRLLQAGEHAVGSEHQEMLGRLLRVRSPEAHEQVLRVVARVGTAELVPALREFQGRRTAGTVQQARLAQTIARIQARASGSVGALSLPRSDGGGLAVVPDLPK